MRASFDAWLHAECGLTFREAAEYTQQELTRLQLGYIVRQDPDGQGGGSGSQSTRKRELRQGQQEAREAMYDDLGFD